MIAVIVEEGTPIVKVYFILEGKCKATIRVPGTKKELHVSMKYIVSGISDTYFVRGCLC